MTTIIYDHKLKQIALDSRVSRHYIIYSDEFIKYKRRDNAIFFFCGVSEGWDIAINHYFGIDEDKTIDVQFFAVEDKKVYYCFFSSEDEFFKLPLRFSEAIGNGYAFALSAHDFGKSPEECIEYAMTRDCGSGGMVRVYDIDTDVFVKG